MTYKSNLPPVDSYWIDEVHAGYIDRAALEATELPMSYDYRHSDFIDQNVQVAVAVNATRTGERPPAEFLDEILPGFEFPPVSVSGINPDLRSWARFVNKDRPIDLNLMIREYMGKSKVPQRRWNDTPGPHFHQGAVFQDMMAGRVPFEINKMAFARKWYFRVPRPQQVIQDVLAGRVDATPSQLSIIRMVTNCAAVLEDQRNFPYKFGATPGHPSCDAMHSTAAGAAVILAAALWDFKPGSTAHGHIVRTAQADGIGRTFLGVHTKQDNVRGFMHGQQDALQIVPELVSEHIPGAPGEDVIRDILQSYAVDYTAVT